MDTPFVRTIVALAALASLSACSLFRDDVVLAGRVVEFKDGIALVSVHSTANARPGQALDVYRVELVPAVKPTAPPWRRPEWTGTALLMDVPHEHAVRVKLTKGEISLDHDVELKGSR